MSNRIKSTNKILYIIVITFIIFLASLLKNLSKEVLAQWDLYYCHTQGAECILDDASDCIQAGCNFDCSRFTGGYLEDCDLPHSCECGPQGQQLNFGQLYNAIGWRFRRPTTIGDIISNLLLYIFPIAGLILLLMLIVGGFKFMFSAGDPKAAQSAKSVITTAVIGFIIIFMAYWLTRLIAIILGLGDITSIF